MKTITMSEMLARINRNFRGLEINENDAIEWVGDCLSQIKIYSEMEEAIHFTEVNDHFATLPDDLQYVVQIARDNQWQGPTESCSPAAVISGLTATEDTTSPKVAKYVAVDCNGYVINNDTEEAKTYQASFDLNAYYPSWLGSKYYQQRYTLVRLSDHTFFKSIVCKPEDNPYEADYNPDELTNNEYTIAGNRFIFSFNTGYVAIAYLRNKVGEDGLPEIPDHNYLFEALSYYVLWKHKQREAYLHKEGARTLAADAELRYKDYIKKFKNYAKMPKGEMQHLQIRERSLYILPQLDRPYGFWGGSSIPEQRIYNKPRNNY